MIVSRDVDLDAIERSHLYHGKYFVLGGSVPILDKEPEVHIRLKELVARLNVMVGKDLGEIVLSLSATPEGDHTVDFLKSTIKEKVPAIGAKNIKITVLGRGLSTGSELEYADSETIRNALESRHS
jgi:recombination protein RecR